MSTVEETVDAEPVVLSAEENRWFGFVKELMPWQFHWLMKSGRECELHDEYTSGVKTLDKVYAEIIKETLHMEPRHLEEPTPPPAGGKKK